MKDIWTLEAGRLLCLNGKPIAVLSTSVRNSVGEFSPTEMDALAHRIVSLLNSAIDHKR